MGKDLEHKKFHMLIKGATTAIIIMNLNNPKEWNLYGVVLAGALSLLFNFIFTEKRQAKIEPYKVKIIRIVGNYLLISTLLYFTDMSTCNAYIPFYFYMVTSTTFYFGIWAGSMVGIVSIMKALMMDQSFHLQEVVNQLLLYGWALTVGYFVYMEKSKNLLLDQKVRELKALDQISRIIDEFPETQEILENITKVVAETMGYTASVIMFYDDEKNRLIAKAGYGLPVEALRRLAREQRFERRLTDMKEPIITYATDGEGNDLFNGESIRFRVTVPLLFRNRVIGTLSIYDREIRSLKKEEKELLYLMSSRIGIILENDRLYKELRFNSITDGLTGLYNHKQFYERLKYEIYYAESENLNLFLLMVDIDRFKRFNDRFGHLVGDKVLVEVAKTIKNSIRETDVAARYGGEEFAIILTNASYETAAVVADRIRYNVKKIKNNLEETKGVDVDITVSIGIACFPDCTNDLANLVDIADLRMYKGKELGGDKVIA